ncbi:MAG: hypothetical protein AB7T01_02340 [Acidithiobacillus sp.]
MSANPDTPLLTIALDAFHDGWEEWRELPLGGRLLFPARSRACIVYDFIVQRAIAAFADDKAVRVLRRDETVKFVFADTVVLRFKKASDNGLGSNIRTQATFGFVDPQQQLPGLPDMHKVEMVYVLNDLQTRIDQVLVAARDNDVCIWSYEITPDSGAQAIPLHTPVPSDGDRGARVKLRIVDEGKKHELGEK